MLLILITAFIPLFVRALRVPYAILMPIIVIFCITGAYSLKNSVWDVGQMLVFGVLGYAMKKLGYSPAALTLALVLGPLAERALRQSLIISDAGLGILFMRPDRRRAHSGGVGGGSGADGACGSGGAAAAHRCQRGSGRGRKVSQVVGDLSKSLAGPGSGIARNRLAPIRRHFGPVAARRPTTVHWTVVERTEGFCCTLRIRQAGRRQPNQSLQLA